MSPSVFLSFFFIVVGLPVLSWAAADMFKRWLKYKEAYNAALSEQTAERAAQYAAKVERLEQRLAVLERILTDRSTRLGEEIERLRDAPIN
jgi:E3 ubiquitin-protein ligase DOA10